MSRSAAARSTTSVAARNNHLAICGATDIGASRPSNQDTFVIADLRSGELSNPCQRTDISLSAQGTLLLVCDGMGGAAAGDLAARIAAESIKQQLVGHAPAVAAHPDESLKGAVVSANGAILAEAHAHPEVRGMGTTCTAAIVLPARLFIAQVGDSRAYLLREGGLRRLTRDQTMADRLVEIGALRSEDVGTFVHRNVLLQAVGTQSTIEPIISEVSLRRADRLLLCSDGLHRCVPDQRIAEILRTAVDISKCARALIAAALAAGGPDNVTVVVADCG